MLKNKTKRKVILITFVTVIIAIAIFTARKEINRYLYIVNTGRRPDSIIAEFRYCYDGDTASFIDEEGEEIRCRFLNIDCPEYDEPYGDKAKEYTDRALKKAGVIELETDPHSRQYDEYGRKLVYVFIDGQLLNEQLVQEGLAYNRYGKTSYRYYDNIRKAENQAKDAKIGIWSN